VNAIDPDTSNRRTKRLNVFFTSVEYAHVVCESRLLNMRPSELMRQKFFSIAPSVVPAINLDAWRELARASANLNQIARYQNSGMQLMADEIVELLTDFRMALVSIPGHE
jgi:hypothetical protein